MVSEMHFPLPAGLLYEPYIQWLLIYLSNDTLLDEAWWMNVPSFWNVFLGYFSEASVG